MHCHQMVFEIASSCESEATVVAHEGSFASVDHHMFKIGALVSEQFVAIFACDGRLLNACTPSILTQKQLK